jgi:ribosomal protein L11 methyltransferase
MFVELVITEDRGRAEVLSDALLECGALSATIEDADAGSSDEEALYGEPGSDAGASGWRRSTVVALFDGAADIDAALVEACAALGIAELPPHRRRPVADANWVALTQSQFEPIAIGERLWIVPSWHESPTARPDAIVLRLDPGMAFGTGDHATTRLCLAWLERNLVVGESVIDFGCGSGILAIAAAKLGAGTVVGTDIDDQAIVASRANARDNDVHVSFTSSKTFHAVPADLVIANILSNPLKVLAPLLTSLVKPSGRLVLSGVLERQWQDVAGAYVPAIALEVCASDAGWVCLSGRPAAAGS